jgi:hypothetical protein
MAARGDARPSVTGALLGGLGASSGILALNQLATWLRLTELDLPCLLGLAFRQTGEDRIKLAGLAWYLTSGSLLIPSLYYLSFRLLGRAGPGPGLAVGVTHWLISGVLLAATRPRRPKRSVGKGRPMGSFVSEYGRLEWCANVAGHLAYGLAIGVAASAWSGAWTSRTSSATGPHRRSLRYLRIVGESVTSSADLGRVLGVNVPRLLSVSN